MRTLRIRLEDWPRHLAMLGPRFVKAAKRGALRGALRGVSTLQRATSLAPPANPAGVGQGGAVNTGQYKRSWKGTSMPDGAKVHNVAPYAGTVEHGRRSSALAPPREAIARWAQRRLNLPRKQALRAAFAIGRAIKRRGLAPRNVLRDSIPAIERDFIDEVRKELDRELATP